MLKRRSLLQSLQEAWWRTASLSKKDTVSLGFVMEKYFSEMAHLLTQS
jgi:hypothetical protein